MKRFWIGISLLILLFLLGAGVGWGTQRIHAPIVSSLLRAQEAAKQEHWADACAHAQEAQKRWETWHHVTAAFTDHEPLEQIEGLFAHLTIYAEARDGTHFCTVCAQLTQLLHAVAESHLPTWWNFL